jgi:hypothetical protein
VKIKNDAINLVLFIFPLCVCIFMIIEGALWPTLTGHSLFGIPPAVGALSMVVSMFGIPFAILRGFPEKK